MWIGGFIISSHVLCFGDLSCLHGLWLAQSNDNLCQRQVWYRYRYPRTWAAFELPDGSHGDNEVIAFFGFASPITKPKVFIAQRSFSNPTLEDVANWGELRLMTDSSPNHIVNLNPVTSPNAHALLRYYSTLSSTPLGKYKNKCMDWYTFDASFGYQLSFCTDETHWSEMENVFMQMAQSFTINK